MSADHLPRSIRRPGDNLTARPMLRRWLAAATLLIVFLACGLLFSAAIDMEVGWQVGLVAAMVALVPVGIVVPAFMWLDRFEAEPLGSLLFAFAWGALIATTVALVLNTGSIIVLQSVSNDAEAVASVMVAPVVEESLKGLGVLLILWFRRREFDGIVDGIVYAGLSAAGFAFAENILYFGRAFLEAGPEGLAGLFIVRGLLGPFAHPLFTMWTGVGVGVAATRHRGLLRVVVPILGLVVAVLLHGLWNLSAVAGMQGFWASYLLLQMPIFLGAIGVVVWARRREARLIAEHLDIYVRHGWLSPVEVGMLTSQARRKEARRWASSGGGRRARTAMVAFQDDATELAFLRMRMRHGTAGPSAALEERALLDTVTRCRGALPIAGVRSLT